MFRNAITETQFTGRLANDLFSRIAGETFRGDVSFISTLRAMAFPRMPEEDILYVHYRETSYNKQNIEGARKSAIIRAVTDTSDRETFASNMIAVYNCCGYSTEDNDAVLDVVESGIGEFARGFTKIEKVSEFFKKVFRVLCYICPETKTTLVFCNGMDLRKFHFLQVATPVMLPWYFAPDAGVTDKEMAVLQSLRGKDYTKYLEAISAIAEQYDFRTLQIKNDLGDFETRFLKREIEQVERSINNNMSDIQNYEDSISRIMRDCYNLNIRLLGLNAKIAEGAGSSEIVDYFVCNKNLYLISVDDSRITFACKGYLEYYDDEILKRYLNNSSSLLYRLDGRDQGGKIPHDDIKMLMTALFVDEIIHMKFCAAYTFDLRGSVTALGSHRYGLEFNDCTPNTHIDRYSCLGNNERAINEQLKKNNYIGAIEQCMSSCKSLNFADSAVINEFMRRIYGISNYDINMNCIELPDGKTVSPKEAIKWLKEQNEQKKKEQEAAAAEAAKEEANE